MSDNKNINDINEDVVQQQDNKLYPKSFRITKDVYDTFKRISKDFSNQDETLKQLCQCYELNENSSALPAKIQTDVQKFNDYVGAIQRLYISSLEYSNVIKDSESEKYKTELNLKDKAINDLEAVINTLKNDKEALDSQIKTLDTEYSQSKQELEQLQKELSNTTSDFQEKLKDKDNLNNMLSTKNKDLENEINLLNSKINSYSELQLENELLKEQLDKSKKEIEKLKLENDKKLIEVKEEYNKKFLEATQQVMEKMSKLDSVYKKREVLLKDQQQLEQKQPFQNTNNKSSRRNKKYDKN